MSACRSLSLATGFVRPSVRHERTTFSRARSLGLFSRYLAILCLNLRDDHQVYNSVAASEHAHSFASLATWHHTLRPHLHNLQPIRPCPSHPRSFPFILCSFSPSPRSVRRLEVKRRGGRAPLPSLPEARGRMRGARKAAFGTGTRQILHHFEDGLALQRFLHECYGICLVGAVTAVPDLRRRHVPCLTDCTKWPGRCARSCTPPRGSLSKSHTTFAHPSTHPERYSRPIPEIVPLTLAGTSPISPFHVSSPRQ